MFAALTRLMALIVALALFVLCVVVLFNTQPVSISGGAIWLILLGLSALVSLGVYRLMTRGARISQQGEHPVGAGLAMGVAVNTARQHRDDDDLDGDMFD